MSDFDFYVDLEDSSGNKLGTGPLTTVGRWQYTARFDRAGEIAFDFSGSDAQAQHVTNRRIARAYAYLNGAWREVGAGVIDEVDTAPGRDGHVVKRVRGLDLLRELSYRNVGKLKLGEGSGTTHSAAVTALQALAPSGWTFTADASPPNDYIYTRYDGESVLGAAVMMADKTQTHFYRGSGRTLVFASDWTDSGVRAIQAGNVLSPFTCAIVSLRKRVDTYDLLTRVHPYGAGQGEARLTLAATTRSAPTGYVLNKTENYIEKTAAITAFGRIDFPELEFKDIAPISNTDADLTAAANMLFDQALRELDRLSTLDVQETYELTIEGCSQLLRPLQTVRVIYRDVDQGIDIDTDLYVLEATWEVTPAGIQTTSLTVSTQDRWPETDESAAAARATQGRVYQAHPQMGPNSYWENATLYIGSDQSLHVGEFPFVLGNEVVTVQQVLLRYKVDAPISFISIVTGSADVEVDVSVDSLDVSVSGTIDISHTHDIPDHQHTITVAGGSSPPDDLLISVSGGTGFLAKASAGDVALNTNVDSGGVTSNSGGSENLSLSGATGSGTGSGSGTVDLDDAIAVAYGIYRADGARTYALDELEYRVNGNAWADLDTGTLTSDDYYQVDITEFVYDDETFRPLQENNLVEIRRKSDAGIIDIESSQGDGSTVGISTNPVEHGLSVGEQVIITGTTYHDGVWTVVEITNEVVFRTNQSGDSNTESPSSGSVFINKAAMVLAKLGVRNTIQSIAYL